jgi:hypothetical protein
MRVTLGEDIPGLRFFGIVIAFWPRLFIGTVERAVQVYGSIRAKRFGELPKAEQEKIEARYHRMRPEKLDVN